MGQKWEISLLYCWPYLTLLRKEMGPKNVHMRCVQISDKGMTKNRRKINKIWGTFTLQYLKLETSFLHAFKG